MNCVKKARNALFSRKNGEKIYIMGGDFGKTAPRLKFKADTCIKAAVGRLCAFQLLIRCVQKVIYCGKNCNFIK